MNFDAYTPLEFATINAHAQRFADSIRSNLDSLVEQLLEYESHEVASDEIARTLDLLDNLEENASYFKLRVGEITTFLPRNQPLYALTCFVLVPSLMSSAVHYRTPQSLRKLLPSLCNLLNVAEYFPNVVVSSKERLEFLKERSAIKSDETGQSKPVTDAVIFTGTPKHAEQLRLVFDKNTLFITNGAGHNPIVVAEKADISAAVAATLTLTLYNQGQDCAAPNTILVHEQNYIPFMNELHTALSQVKIGRYKDPECRVGPISNPKELPHIQSILVDNQPWLDEQTPGVIHTAESIVEPTIIAKPLTDGANYNESFAPILFIQKYEKDADLATYFSTKEYAKHVMYVTLYGTSAYVESLIQKPGTEGLLHTKETFLHNTHLHAPGVERGTQPYGGYGVGASNISINGTVTGKPTLPQRDIYEYVAKPILDAGNVVAYREKQALFTTVAERKVEKIMKLHNETTEQGVAAAITTHMYCDMSKLTSTGRFVEIPKDETYHLLDVPNVEYIATLNPHDIDTIRSVRQLHTERAQHTEDSFKKVLYDIPKLPTLNQAQNIKRQKLFFKHLYWLLFHQDTGPRLASFLFELENEDVDKLLDV